MKVKSGHDVSHGRFGRYLLTAALVALPITMIPLLLQGSAQSAENGSPPTQLAAARTVNADVLTAKSAADCVDGKFTIGPVTLDGSGHVSVDLYSDACTDQQFSLVAYTTEGPDWATSGVQHLAAIDTQTVTGHAEFNVTVPSCYFQLDLIYGSDAPQVLQAGESYFADKGTLIASYNGGQGPCVVTSTTPPTSTPPTTEPPTSTPPTTEPPTSVEPSTTVTTTPPPTTTTTTTTSEPPTSVLPTTWTTTPGAVVAATSSSLPTQVLAEQYNQEGQLPFTGPGAPVGTMIAIGVEALLAGVALLLICAGRRRRAGGSHR
ncbi:MAG TPA: hypothetical protein VHC41_00360 [Mycobacteriales bacterium]|nr:hypothetical protein [Mycobacteriales bacterium]